MATMAIKRHKNEVVTGCWRGVDGSVTGGWHGLGMTEHPDRAIARRAEQQYGVFTRSQAADQDLTHDEISLRVQNGRWDLLRRGLYLVGGAPDSWRRQLMEAVLAAGERAAVSHRAAAALHGIEGFRPGVVEVTTPRPSPWVTSVPE